MSMQQPNTSGKKRRGRPPKSPEERKKARTHTDAVRQERNRRNYYSMPENKYGHILYCGICGSHMGYFRTNLEGANPYVMYQCKFHKVWKYGPDACPRENIRLEELDELVLREMQKEIDYARYLLKERNESENSLYSRILKHFQEEMDDAYTVVGQDHKRQFKAFVKWKDGLMDEQEYVSIRSQCLASEQEHLNIWWKKQFLYSHIHLHYNKDNGWIKAMLSLPYDTLPSKEVFQKMIYRIDLYEDNHIEITWRKNLTRERLYQFLEAIDAIPEGMYNPSHRGCVNRALFLLSDEDMKPNNSPGGES